MYLGFMTHLSFFFCSSCNLAATCCIQILNRTLCLDSAFMEQIINKHDHCVQHLNGITWPRELVENWTSKPFIHINQVFDCLFRVLKVFRCCIFSVQFKNQQLTPNILKFCFLIVQKQYGHLFVLFSNGLDHFKTEHFSSLDHFRNKNKFSL